MHAQAYDAVAQMLQTIPVPTRVVEFGSCDINGSVRPLFPGARYCGVDVVPGPAVDVVGDAATFTTIPAPDAVVCCEVLEHAEHADAIVANALRILAPGGWFLVTCASEGRAPHSAVDGGSLRHGEFYRNVPPDDLRAWLAAAGAVSIDLVHRPDRGDLYALAQKPEGRA